MKPDRPARRTAPRPYRIVFEDADLIVADKDPGILTVPIPGKSSRNLKDLLDRYLMGQKREAHVVHRIDRYTSGLVLFAKNRRARGALVAQFRQRTPERVYLALVRGVPAAESGTLRNRLELTADGFRQRVVREGGTEAVTHYRVVERLPAAALLEVRLESGLKNQIRVQFRAAGHPLVGDRHYAREEAAEVKLGRQALHAWKLSFVHPGTGKPVSFEAPLPRDLERALRSLRQAPPPKPSDPTVHEDVSTRSPGSRTPRRVSGKKSPARPAKAKAPGKKGPAGARGTARRTGKRGKG